MATYNNSNSRNFSVTTNVVDFDCKELPIKLAIEQYIGDNGEIRNIEKFYVEVLVDGELERIDLRSEKKLKKRKLVEYISRGDCFNLKVRQKEFRKGNDTIKYAAFYTPMVIDRFSTEMRFSIDVGKDGDNRLERHFLLRALGLSYDSIDGLSDYNEDIE